MALPAGNYTIQSATPGLKKYLLCMGDGNLQFSGDDRTVPNAKFQLEENTDRNGLMHIRSSNGRYWRRESESSYRIQPIADQVIENQSSWLCTLFSIVNDEDKYRINHVQLRHFIEPSSADSFRAYALHEPRNGNQLVDFQAI